MPKEYLYCRTCSTTDLPIYNRDCPVCGDPYIRNPIRDPPSGTLIRNSSELEVEDYLRETRFCEVINAEGNDSVDPRESIDALDTDREEPFRWPTVNENLLEPNKEEELEIPNESILFSELGTQQGNYEESATPLPKAPTGSTSGESTLINTPLTTPSMPPSPLSPPSRQFLSPTTTIYSDVSNVSFLDLNTTGEYYGDVDSYYGDSDNEDLNEDFDDDNSNVVLVTDAWLAEVIELGDEIGWEFVRHLVPDDIAETIRPEPFLIHYANMKLFMDIHHDGVWVPMIAY